MTDLIDSTLTDTPAAEDVVVNLSPTLALIGVAVRALAVATGTFMTVAGLASRHDLTGLIAFARGDEVVPFLSAIGTLSAVGFSIRRVFANKAKLKEVAAADPAKIIVKGE